MVWSGGGSRRSADFTFINRGDIKNLDPLRMTYLQDIRIGYALWEGLYTLHPQTLEPIPGCADRIDISSDKTIYTFNIRTQAKWSNGDDVTANDFVFAWRRMLREQGDYSDLLHYIKGARQYQRQSANGENPDFKNVGIEIIDKKTLRVTLENPTAFFPDLCAFPPLFPLHETSMMQTNLVTGEKTIKDKWLRPPNLVSNGPYRFESWDFKRRLRLAASDHYWDRQNVKSPIIDMLVSENPQTRFSMFKTGEVDWVSDMTGEFGAELRNAGHPDLHVFTGFGTYFYSFNCQEKLPDGQANPLRDARVRQALSMAIDKRFIVEKITRLGEPMAANYIPPGIFKGYQSPAGLPFDVERAKRLLAEAGYPDGRDFPELKINFNNEGQHKAIAEYIQRQWADHLNINILLDGKELKAFGEQLRTKNYAISRASWIGDYNDPSTFTDKYRSNAGNNDSAWINPEFDQLCRQAAAETDQSKRMELFRQAEQLLLDEAPILPLYHYVNAYMYRDHVKGIPLDPRNMVMFKAVEVGGR